jgi:mannosyltransferase
MMSIESKISSFLDRAGKKPFWFLFFLVLLNAGLKFFQLRDASLWLDEAHTALQSLKNISEIISDSANDQNPPFYFIMMHFWVKIFGISEFGIRFFSALFSTITVVLIFQFARKNINVFTAIFSSILFTFSEQQIYFADEARSFAFVGFLCMLSFIIFYDLIKNPTYKKAFYLGLINAILIYSHYISCFIVLVQAVYILLIYFLQPVNKKIFAIEIGSFLVTTVLFLPWISNLRKSMPRLGEYWLKSPTFYNLKGLFISFSNGKLMTILFAMVIFWWIIFSLKRFKNKIFFKEKKVVGILLLLWVFLPVFADYLLSRLTPIFLIKYLLYSSIGFYLLIGYSVTELPINLFRKILISTLLILIFIAATHFKVNKPEDWRKTVEYTKSISTSRDAIVLSPSYVSNPFLYYYDQVAFKNYKRRDSIMSARNIYNVDEIKNDELKELEKQERIIFIMAHATKDLSSLKSIGNYFLLEKELNFGDVNLYIFQKGNTDYLGSIRNLVL